METILNIKYKTVEVRASDGALHISLARRAVRWFRFGEM